MSCPLGGGIVGGNNRAMPDLSADPLKLTSAQLIQLACAIARVGAIICDVGKVGSEQRYGLLDEEPYIWDLKED